jgi:hypothetical protein
MRPNKAEQRPGLFLLVLQESVFGRRTHELASQRIDFHEDDLQHCAY